jgi:hypothetical protein
VPARGALGRPEDARVGQRVAVDLERDDVGQRPGGRLRVRGVELGGGLVDVQGAGEGHRRVRARAQPGQPVEHHVDLQL